MTVPDAQTPAPSRHFEPSPLLAGGELLLAGAVIAAGLTLPVSAFMLGSAPWLVALAMLLVWWRGPGWREVGLGRPTALAYTVAAATLVGVGYQFFGTFVVEPVIVRLTSGTLPDVSVFRSIVGDEMELMYWIAIAWSLGALVEEVAYRGWIMARFAELGRFSRSAWLGGMVASSVLFGIVHLYQGLSGMIATGLSGLVFAGIYLATGRNLWASVVAHGAMNTTGFVMMYFGVYPGM